MGISIDSTLKRVWVAEKFGDAPIEPTHTHIHNSVRAHPSPATPTGKIPCATPKPSQTGIELGWARSAPGAVPPRYERVRNYLCFSARI